MAVATVTAQRFEQELTWLENELDSVNVSYAKRMEFKNQIAHIVDQFGKMEPSEATLHTLSMELDKVDYALAEETVRQAEAEISKSAHTHPAYQALENIKKEMGSGQIKPARVRHMTKEIMRTQ